MAKQRKPISFDTTLRNPSRIPQFISILSAFEGRQLDSETALEIEAEIIRWKVFVPTKATLGTYAKSYDGKFHFWAKDQSSNAKNRVQEIFTKWEKSDAGLTSKEDITYLLKNTITAHKEAGWNGGWESRLHTQFNFLNELGFVRVVKGEKILISENGKLMIKAYKNGYPVEEVYDESFEQSAFLNAFAKYQINNPYRRNTVEVNFFPLVLKVIKYLDDKYDRPGIFRWDLPFIIAWGNNDYTALGEYIHDFRDEYGYNVSDEIIYEYAMNLLDDAGDQTKIVPARESFIKAKSKHFKFDKLTSETPDEVIRKLRLTMLVSLRGAGRFIDINKNEIDKIQYIINNYAENRDFGDDAIKYFDYMGKVDSELCFKSWEQETEKSLDAKNKAIEKWALESSWEFLKDEMEITVDKRPSSHLVLKYIKETARLEFLSAVVIKKALPNIKVKANYKADDQGIPFNTASGNIGDETGADIDLYEDSIHAIMEPTISKSRSMQVEHEIPSIRNHVFHTAHKDFDEGWPFDEWFAIFLAPNMARDVGDQVALIRNMNNVEIYPWDVVDFVEYSRGVKSIRDYKIIRDYAKPQRMPNKMPRL